MATQTPIAKQTVPREDIDTHDWIAPDTVAALHAELQAVTSHAPSQMLDEVTLQAFFQPAIRLPVCLPIRVMHRAAELAAGAVQTWDYGVPSLPTIEAPVAPRRFDVDPQAMSALVDWAIERDFGIDGGERIRGDAWH